MVASICGAAGLGGLGACTATAEGPGTVGASVATTVTSKSGQALTIDGEVATFQAVNGTFGSGCTARSGDWSTPIGAFSGALMNPALSVVSHNGTSCVLTLTSLTVNGRTYSPNTTSALSAAYAPAALAFTTNSDPFYANFKITPDDFSTAFSLDMFASDDVNAVPGAIAASYATVSPSGTASTNPAPDYSLNTSGVSITADRNQVVQSVSGNLVMTVGTVAGSAYVRHSGALDPSSSAAVDEAYKAGTENAITGSSFNVAASDVGLTVGVTTLPATRYIIVKNTTNAVTTYEVITVTFSPAS